MILILGGTTEGRLAVNTLDESGSPFYYSTRGDEQEVSLHHGIRLQGGMDAGAMEQFCRQRESGYWSMPLILLLRNCIATWLQWGNVCKSL